MISDLMLVIVAVLQLIIGFVIGFVACWQHMRTLDRVRLAEALVAEALENLRRSETTR